MAKRSRLQLKKDLLPESKVWFDVPLDVKDKAITGYHAAKNDLPAESKVLFEFTVDHKDFKEFTRGYLPENTTCDT